MSVRSSKFNLKQPHQSYTRSSLRRYGRCVSSCRRTIIAHPASAWRSRQATSIQLCHSRRPRRLSGRRNAGHRRRLCSSRRSVSATPPTQPRQSRGILLWASPNGQPQGYRELVIRSHLPAASAAVSSPKWPCTVVADMTDEERREPLDRRGNPHAHQAVADQHGRTNCTQLHRSRGAVRARARRLCREGLLESKNATRRGQSIKPDPQDFDEVKTDYCRKHHITIAELGARFERDDRLAAELYRLALAAKLTRRHSRPVGLVGGETPATGSSLLPTPSANGAPTRQRRP